jgi:ABC-type uncharacterized transport system permease subunit/ABC-type Fe3+ transport system substrate-binding protein
MSSTSANSFALSGAQDGLYAPYKVATWNDIPDGQKDTGGLWTSDYGGYISIGCNATKVGTCPKTIKELDNPAYKNMVALNGDPTESNSAFQGVWALALANGGSADDIQPGIDYVKKLKRRGHLQQDPGDAATVASGATPIVLDWDYLNVAEGTELAKKGQKWEVNDPADGLVSAYYAQAINRSAPHPAAARLWEEYLYSQDPDGGQNLWLKGLRPPDRARGDAEERLGGPGCCRQGSARHGQEPVRPHPGPGDQGDRHRHQELGGGGSRVTDSHETGGTGSTRSRRVPLAWLGLTPFLAYVTLVFLVPIGFILFEAFRRTTTTGATRDPVTQQFVKHSETTFTLDNIHDSLQGIYRTSLVTSVKLSAITAILGAIFGLLLATAVVSSSSAFLRQVVTSAAAVTANFGGIPLAFLFIANLDANSGIVTLFLQDHFGISLQDDLGLQLPELSGLSLVYLYFLIPLMVLVMAPALEGLKPQWAEAAENLGASRWTTGGSLLRRSSCPASWGRCCCCSARRSRRTPRRTRSTARSP